MLDGRRTAFSSPTRQKSISNPIEISGPREKGPAEGSRAGRPKAVKPQERKRRRREPTRKGDNLIGAGVGACGPRWTHVSLLLGFPQALAFFFSGL